MRIIILTIKSFDKDYKKCSLKVREAFKKRRNLFLENPYHRLLNNHKLTAKYAGYRSLNITGDIRAIYYQSEDACTFIRISTHSELYE